MADNQTLFFGEDDFGIQATNTLAAEELSSFLNGDADKVELNTPSKKETVPSDTTKEEKKEEKKEEDRAKTLSESDIFGEEETKEEDASSKKAEKAEEEEEEDGEDEGVYSALSKALFDLGVFTKDEDEEDVTIDSDEDFKKRFEYEMAKGANRQLLAYVSRNGEDYSDMFQTVFVDGVSPKVWAQSYNKLDNISSLSPQNESEAEILVKTLFRQEGRSNEYINSRIEKFKNYGDLEEEAETAKEILVQKEQTVLAQQAEQARQAQEDRKKQRLNFVQTVNTIITDKLKKGEFDGIPMTKDSAIALNKYLTEEKYKLPNGQLLSEFDKELLDLKRPENLELQAKFAALWLHVKKDPHLSKIKKKGVAEEANKTFQSVIKKAKKRAVVKEDEEDNFFNI